MSTLSPLTSSSSESLLTVASAEKGKEPKSEVV